MLVDWYADWCGPCKLIEPMLAELAASDANIRVVKAKPEHTEAFRSWMVKHGGSSFSISGLPTCVLFKDGKPVKSLVGRFNRQKLDAAIAEVTEAVRGVVSPKLPGLLQPKPQPVPVPIPVPVQAANQPWKGRYTS